MSEVVQKRMELMTPEVEELRRIKLYSEEEIKRLVIKRKEFEYKINSRTKDLQHFTDYINYEKCLLKSIKLRRDKFRCGEKKNSIEYSLIRRIKSLYEIALERFPEELQLFYSFLKFCKKVNFINAASVTVSRMIMKHSHNPEVWLTVIKWHREQRHDVKTAMNILMKALAIHENNELLYRELIFTKIYEFKQCTNLDENKEQQELHLKQMELVMEIITQHIGNYKFYIFVLRTFEKYEFLKKIQNSIKELLKTKYSNCAAVQNYFSKTEMQEQ